MAEGDSDEYGTANTGSSNATPAETAGGATSQPSADRENYHRDTFDVTYEEARRVVDYQLDSISDIDSKAAHTLRVLFVLFGLLITAISVVVKATLQQDGTDIATAKQFINAFTTSGVVFLLLSLLVAIWTYNETNTRSGLSPYEILNLAEEEPRQERFEHLFGRFPSWILYDEAAIRKDSTLLFLSHSFLFASVVALVVGVLAELPFDVSKHALRVPIPMSLTSWFAASGVIVLLVGLLDTFSDSLVGFLSEHVGEVERNVALMICGVLLLLVGFVFLVLSTP